jgi:hypothetical protein
VINSYSTKWLVFLTHYSVKIFNQMSFGLEFSEWLDNLDKNAFAGAHVCGMHHRVHVAGSDWCERTCSTWVIHRLTGTSDIGNAIFELHKDIGAQINTEAIPSTEILVNPHVHTETVPVLHP